MRPDILLREIIQRKWSIHCITYQGWTESRQEFVQLMKKSLSRNLEPYEEQMINWAKACSVCHTQENLLTCLNCYSANYCTYHKSSFKGYHSYRCHELLLSLKLDIEQVYSSTLDIDKLVFGRERLKLNDFPYEDKPTFKIELLITKYLEPERFLKFEDWCLYSEYVTDPLTFYHGLVNETDLLHPQDLLGSSYVIHIICTDSMDKKYLLAWKFLLYILPVKNLTIVVIEQKPLNMFHVMQDTSPSDYKNQEITFETCRMLYHDYVHSEVYKKPNVILGFDIDFTKAIWSESITKFKEQCCPLLVTFKSETQSEDNIDVIHKILKLSVFPIFYERNKFKSNTPSKSLEYDDIFYRNDYLLIFRNLYTEW
ncbi:uncharacterized protein LOC105191161 [Harpegnathos saltator]|uniref:uncharacterized protein LOC105191161 n=1 Tax=Harpegnathos saltator TaxID=610380 RepID=UPI000DBEEF40|nr:uncharacterized protein LOC105191161 [Harpegnathos saltator]